MFHIISGQSGMPTLNPSLDDLVGVCW